jgi:hypothetical protein
VGSQAPGEELQRCSSQASLLKYFAAEDTICRVDLFGCLSSDLRWRSNKISFEVTHTSLDIPQISSLNHYAFDPAPTALQNLDGDIENELQLAQVPSADHLTEKIPREY